MVCERSLEHWNDVYICFAWTLKKAFDRVNWVRMMETLKDLGIDSRRDRRMIHPTLHESKCGGESNVDGESEPGLV